MVVIKLKKLKEFRNAEDHSMYHVQTSKIIKILVLTLQNY